jgi:hypothetical protein
VVLDTLLASWREPTNKIGSNKIGSHVKIGSCQDRLPVGSQNRTPENREARPSFGPGLLTWYFRGVGEGTRTPGPQDHNNVAEGERPRKTPVFQGFLIKRRHLHTR